MLFTSEKLVNQSIENQLTQQEKREALEQAKNTVTHLDNANQELYLPIRSFGITRLHGAFVTLRTPDHQLRGCIGRVITEEPLYKVITQVAHDAALRDSRFNPVAPQEIPSLKVELSVLSVPQKVKSYAQIQLDKNGIILENKGKSALFLPEVSQEFKWTLEQTLEQLAQKAGLPATAWQDPDTSYKVFSTLILK